jgi:hypothetical protein
MKNEWGQTIQQIKTQNLCPTDVEVNNGVFPDVTLYGSCKIRVSEELSASFIRVKRIDELGTTLAVTSNRRTLRRNTKSVATYS